jgi:2-dehydro-3-deoxyphosphogluconate aldolase/(4S)-4-hydroxy-2-oxoglutarate aldolase
MARFDRLSVYQAVFDAGLVPLFYHAQAETAFQVAAALAQGGSRLLEFTNRGDFAIEVFSALIRRCAAELPELIVGVGTVEDAATAALYIAHGANFVVAPTFSEEVARLCNRRKIPYIPGCQTVNEIARAEEWGVELVKLFPADGIRGPEFVKAVLGPRPWTRIMPTGGVSADEANLRTWFAAGVSAVGIGGNLIRADWVKAGDYAAITAQTEALLGLIRGIRARG